MEPKTQEAEAAAAPAARHTRECFERQYIIELPENPYRSCICASEPADSRAGKGERLAAEPPLPKHIRDEMENPPGTTILGSYGAAQPPPPDVDLEYWADRIRHAADPDSERRAFLQAICEPPRGVTPALDVLLPLPPDGWQFYELVRGDDGKWEASFSKRLDDTHWDFIQATGATAQEAIDNLRLAGSVDDGR